MSLIPFIVLVATPEAVTIAGRIEAAHAKMAKVAVAVSDGLSNVVPTKIKIAPGVCVLQMPNQQIVEVKANEVRFYDEIFNQVASLKNAKAAKLPDSAARVAIVQRDPIAWFVDSGQKKSFFSDMKRDKRWQVRGRLLLLLDPKKRSLSEVHFDNSYRIIEIKLRVNDRTVYDWKYEYVSEAKVPSIPVLAKVVKGLVPRPSIPQKTDGRTVLFSQKVWRSVSRLEGRSVTQIADDGTYNLTFGKGKLAESGLQAS